MQQSIQLLTTEQVETVIGNLIRRELGCITREASIPKAVYDTREASVYLKQSEHTLRQWRSQSRGPTYLKDVSGVRYLKKDLDAWLAGNRVFTAEAPDAPR
jgi:hypothetical protein